MLHENSDRVYDIATNGIATVKLQTADKSKAFDPSKIDMPKITKMKVDIKLPSVNIKKVSQRRLLITIVAPGPIRYQLCEISLPYEIMHTCILVPTNALVQVKLLNIDKRNKLINEYIQMVEFIANYEHTPFPLQASPIGVSLMGLTETDC